MGRLRSDSGQAATEYLVAALCTMLLVWGLFGLMGSMGTGDVFRGVDASVSHAADGTTGQGMLWFLDPVDFVLDILMY